MFDDAAELICHDGLFHQAFIGQLSRLLPARTYFEIGTESGASLAAVDCPSIAVDPRFQISHDIVGIKPACHLFQTTSDQFFEEFDPRLVLGEPIDLAFLDGLHLFEVLLRDFINTERHCSRDSIILLHDCLPPTFEMTTRRIIGQEGNERGAVGHPKYRGYWTGDVWKVVAILRDYRPDLRAIFVDSLPVGLALYSNLDPNSTILLDRYEEIVGRYAEREDDRERLKSLYRSITMVSTANLMDREELIARIGRST